MCLRRFCFSSVVSSFFVRTADWESFFLKVSSAIRNISMFANG